MLSIFLFGKDDGVVSREQGFALRFVDAGVTSIGFVKPRQHAELYISYLPAMCLLSALAFIGE